MYPFRNANAQNQERALPTEAEPAMTRPAATVFGLRESVYVRTVLLTLDIKGIPFEFSEVDPFTPGGVPAGYDAVHPFGRVPALDHDGFMLYETAAITRYLDEAFGGPALQPSEVRERARMTQAIGVLDSYAYRCWVWDFYVSCKRAAEAGGQGGWTAPEPAADLASRTLAALEAIMGTGAFLAGTREPTLADLHAAPMMRYGLEVPQFRRLLERRPALHAWWRRVAALPSVQAVCPVRKGQQDG